MLDIVKKIWLCIPPKVRLSSIIIVGSLTFFMVMVLTKTTIKPVIQKPPIRYVQAHTVHYAPAHLNIPAYGQVVSSRKINLRALVEGEVIDVNPKLLEGALFKKGEMLLKLDPFEYQNTLDEVKALLSSAQASLKLAKSDFDNANILFEKGNVSQSHLNNLETKYIIQKAKVDQLNIALRRAKRDFRNTKIIVPFESYVSDIQVREGRLVNKKDKILHLKDAKNYQIKFNLSETEYDSLLKAKSDIKGKAVEAIWKIGTQNSVLKAVVTHIAGRIDRNIGGINVISDVVDVGHIPIRDGAFVNVTLKAKSFSKIAMIPNSALFANNVIYLIRDNKLKKKILINPIKMGDFVLVNDVNEEEKILLHRFIGAEDGVAVQIR